MSFEDWALQEGLLPSPRARYFIIAFIVSMNGNTYNIDILHYSLQSGIARADITSVGFTLKMAGCHFREF